MDTISPKTCQKASQIVGPITFSFKILYVGLYIIYIYIYTCIYIGVVKNAFRMLTKFDKRRPRG